MLIFAKLVEGGGGGVNPTHLTGFRLLYLFRRGREESLPHPPDPPGFAFGYKPLLRISLWEGEIAKTAGILHAWQLHAVAYRSRKSFDPSSRLRLNDLCDLGYCM